MNKKELPPTQSTTVIELRQLSAKSISTSNADFRVVLDKDITIEPMDVVKIKSCFIDSVALNSDKIIVLPDVPKNSADYNTATFAEKNFKKLTTSHNFYYKNWGSTYLLPGSQRDYKFPEETQPFVDGRDYIATYESVKPGGEEQDLVSGIAFKFVGTFSGKHQHQKMKDPVHINLQYTQFCGATGVENIRYLHILVSQKELQKQYLNPNDPQADMFYLDKTVDLSRGSQGINFPIQCKKDSIIISLKNDKHQDKNATQLHEGGLIRTATEIAEDVRTADPAIVTFVPMTFPQDFLLRAGEYNKVELAREMSLLLSKPSSNVLDKAKYDISNIAGGVYPNELSGNTFLMSTDSLRQTRGNGAEIGTLSPNTQGRVFFCATDGQNAFQFKASNPLVDPQINDYWIGSDEGIALQYNQEVNKFELIQMHMSLRDSNSNAITRGSDTSGTGFTISNKLTGIYLQDLQPANFWFDDLNFDKSLLVHEGSVLQAAATDYPTWPDNIQRTIPLVPDLKDGVNITGDSYTLANLTFKGNQAEPGPNQKTRPAENGHAFDIADVPIGFDIAVNQTTSIYSNTNNGVGDTDDHEKKGFFKIEVDMGINNEIVGGEHNNKIKSVINRFYTVDSYTSTYGEGDILYQHPAGAAPIKTSDIGIRILKPDGTLSDELGNANSVFLEIIKNR